MIVKPMNHFGKRAAMIRLLYGAAISQRAHCSVRARCDTVVNSQPLCSAIGRHLYLLDASHETENGALHQFFTEPFRRDGYLERNERLSLSAFGQLV
jgi:hypothetical protein